LFTSIMDQPKIVSYESISLLLDSSPQHSQPSKTILNQLRPLPCTHIHSNTHRYVLLKPPCPCAQIHHLPYQYSHPNTHPLLLRPQSRNPRLRESAALPRHFQIRAWYPSPRQYHHGPCFFCDCGHDELCHRGHQALVGGA
jgi:hypothetical protein